MKSNMQHNFANVPKVGGQRSVFNRTHTYKTTFDSGKLIPFYVDEILPGDSFNVNATIFARLATPIAPFMDNLFLDVQYFFVPTRLVWNNFKRFMGEKDNPDDSIDYVVPQIVAPAGGWPIHSLSDYFGLPTEEVGLSVSSLWHRAYNLIWNEWYRAQHIQDSVVVDKDDGPDTDTDYVVLRRGKRHDYFTSCLPWPQMGEAISIPLTGDAPVKGIGMQAQVYNDTENVYETDGVGTVNYADSLRVDLLETHVQEDPSNAGYPNIRADLSGVTAATINDLREAFQLQKYAEREARGGTRYTELVKSFFNVSSPDARLQRSEFLAGGSVLVDVVQVEQNSETLVGTPQGNMSGYGTVTSRSGFNKSFTEHGLIIGICSVRADLTYQQGIPRMFSRTTRYDYYSPPLAHLGEQAVLNKEIYAKNDANDDAVFGYIPRYDEYRYYASKITGVLRSTYATSLHLWHLSQEFTTLPTLSPVFIEDNPPVDRVIAVQDEPHFIMDCFIKQKAVRPMPTYAVPGMIDHF